MVYGLPPDGYEALCPHEQGKCVVEYEPVERESHHALLKLRGDLTGELPVERLHDELKEHYVDDGVRVIQVDLSEVRSLTLEGVAVLLALWRESQQRGKRFMVRGAAGQVREKLRTTGVLDVLSRSSPPPGRAAGPPPSSRPSGAPGASLAS
jgi:anti-anti-sigma factor